MKFSPGEVVAATIMSGLQSTRSASWAQGLVSLSLALLRFPRLSIIRADRLPFDFTLVFTTMDVAVSNSQSRIGIGHDTHRLAEGGPLVLGGLSIEHTQHAVGHSDADVLLHAITDAVLGAAALGDVGELFPDTDEENLDRDSADMLGLAYQRVQEAGYQIENLDCIIFLQAPKLSPYKEKMQKRVAEILKLTPERVGIKAKTGEYIGEIGRGECLMAQCVTLLTCR